MKKTALFLIACWPVLWLPAQTLSIAEAELRDLDGKSISSAEIIRNGKPTLLVFWEPADRSGCDNLENIASAWSQSLKQQGVDLVAICTDRCGSWTRVKPIVNGNGWEFATYIDVNGEFKRSMNAGEHSCTMLFDENRNMVCRIDGGCTGSEEFICLNILEHFNIVATAANYK
jgi:cytochrome c biogenesis protein CcmG, thiol:disulfide interchange protein DsbE